MEKSVIGGPWGPSCSSVLSVGQLHVPHSTELMNLGYPPFCSENAHDVYRKIIDWRNHLFFPDDVHLSPEAEDLVRR